MLVGGLVVGFGVLARAARGESVLRGDVRFAHWMQGRDWPGLDPLMETANWSARSVPAVIAAAVIAGGLARKRRLDEAVVLVAAVVIMHASYALKELIASPRPASDLIRVPDAGGGFGFPGGRSGNVVLFLGTLAWIIGRHAEARWVRIVVWVAAVVWVVLVGMARVWFGAHWPSDVLGSWLWTIPVLIVLTWAADQWQDRHLAEIR